MREFATLAELAALAGEEIGTSEWITIDQAMIDGFAAVTGDHQWIHVDVERARREFPGGSTIAHGYLLLSLLPRLQKTIYTVRQRSRGINYGLDRVRFLAPVPAGTSVQLQLVLDRAQAVPGGVRLYCTATMTTQDAERPVLVAATIAQLYA